MARGPDRRQLLLEQWNACQGIWTQSELLFTLKQTSAHRKRGCRKWLTRSEIANKYGSEQIAQSIVDAKLSDEEASRNQVRIHPDVGKDTEDTRLNEQCFLASVRPFSYNHV